jgi:hypothetical protein
MISGTPTLEVYEANITDENGYKNDFLKTIQPKLDKPRHAMENSALSATDLRSSNFAQNNASIAT